MSRDPDALRIVADISSNEDLADWVGVAHCDQVHNLKALRQMASELYSYNAMSLEAEEMRAQLAGLKLRQASGSAAAVITSEAPVEIVTVEETSLEQRRESGASASSKDTFSKESPSTNVEAQAEVRDERQSEGEEVAELASRMWNGAEVERQDTKIESLNGHSFERREAEIVESSVDVDEATSRLEILAGGINLPHPGKASTGGEDAFFTSTLFGGAVGVADGVSAWARDGVDAALYSRYHPFDLNVLFKMCLKRGCWLPCTPGACAALLFTPFHLEEVVVAG